MRVLWALAFLVGVLLFPAESLSIGSLFSIGRWGSNIFSMTGYSGEAPRVAIAPERSVAKNPSNENNYWANLYRGSKITQREEPEPSLPPEKERSRTPLEEKIIALFESTLGTENEHPHAPLEYAPILSALFKSAEMKELIARFQGGLEAAQTEEALTAFHASAEMGGIIHRLNDVLKDLLVAINARPETVQIKEAALAFYKSAEIQDILARFGESLNDLSEFAEISILDILDRLGNALEDTEVDEAIEALFLSGDIHPLLDRLVEYARDSQIAEPVLAFLESAEKKTIWGRLQDSCKERRQAIYAHINHTTDSTQIKEAVLALSTSTAMGEIVARLKNAREELSRPAEMGEPIIITTDFTILYRIGDIVARLEDVFQAAQVKDADPIEMKTAMRLLLRDLWCLETDMRWKTYLSRDGTQSRPRSLASSL